TRQADGRLHVREPAAVVLGKWVKRTNLLPHPLLRLRAGPRRDIPDREERIREHLRADEGVLPLPAPEDALDAFLARPRLAVGGLTDASREVGVAHPGQPAAVGIERLERLEAEEARVP